MRRKGVEGFAVAIVPRSGMVAANDEMRAAIVLANDGVPQGFAGPGQTHGKVEQAQRGGLFRVLFQYVLVAADTREVIYVARFGHANHRMDQQIGLDFARHAERSVPGVRGAVGCGSGKATTLRQPSLRKRPRSSDGVSLTNLKS